MNNLNILLNGKNLNLTPPFLLFFYNSHGGGGYT